MSTKATKNQSKSKSYVLENRWSIVSAQKRDSRLQKFSSQQSKALKLESPFQYNPLREKTNEVEINLRKSSLTAINEKNEINSNQFRSPNGKRAVFIKTDSSGNDTVKYSQRYLSTQ